MPGPFCVHGEEGGFSYGHSGVRGVGAAIENDRRHPWIVPATPTTFGTLLPMAPVESVHLWGAMILKGGIGWGRWCRWAKKPEVLAKKVRLYQGPGDVWKGPRSFSS